MSTLYATFHNPKSAEQAAQDLLQAGASSTDMRVVCWPSGGMVSLVTPTGRLDRPHSEQIIQRYSPVSVGDTFEMRRDGAGTNLYEADFQADCLIRFQGARWENFYYQDFQPAYYYGSELAHDMHLRDCDWGEVEGEARQNWPSHFSLKWEDIKGAVQFGYERVNSGLIAPL
jgi:hypothetical protein